MAKRLKHSSTTSPQTLTSVINTQNNYHLADSFEYFKFVGFMKKICASQNHSFAQKIFSASDFNTSGKLQG